MKITSTDYQRLRTLQDDRISLMMSLWIRGKTKAQALKIINKSHEDEMYKKYMATLGIKYGFHPALVTINAKGEVIPDE